MNKRFSPALIGGFVVSGVVLVVVAIIAFGSGRIFDQTRTYIAFFPGSVNGLTVGSNVSFRGVPIGTVTDVLLSMSFDVDNMGADMRIPVIFEIDLGAMTNRGVTSDIGRDDRMQLLLDRGMSARLDTESFVTGRLFVSLDFRPGTERFTQGGQTEYLEIPTVRSPIAEVGNSLQQLADKFIALDADLILDEFRETLAGMNTLLTSDEIQTLPNSMGEMLAQTEQTLLALQDLAETVDGSIARSRIRSSGSPRARSSRWRMWSERWPQSKAPSTHELRPWSGSWGHSTNFSWPPNHSGGRPTSSNEGPTC